MGKKINFGYVKDSLVKNASSLYLNENKIDKSLKEFLNIVKSSPVLTLEFIIYKNIENKYISDDNLATRYIDENLSMLKNFTKKEIIEENNKIVSFVNEDHIINENKNTLYESIESIILENCIDNKFKNVDKIHSSFENILNHIKNNKENDIIQENKSVFEEYKDKYLNTDFIFNNAIKKFNEKYSHLSEGEKRLLKVFINEDVNKEELFNNIISETIDIINNHLKNEEDSNISNKLIKVKEKINEMKFNENTIIDDFVKLNTLKESLL